jgi:hypothetical protein
MARHLSAWKHQPERVLRHFNVHGDLMNRLGDLGVHLGHRRYIIHSVPDNPGKSLKWRYPIL